MTVLELRGVVKSFDDHTGIRRVLDGVDLTVEAGEIVALTGRSGSGKTTLLTVVAGFEPPDEGTVALLEGPAEHRPWGDLAILPQSLALLTELTISENVLLPLRLAGRTSVTRPGAGTDVDVLFERLGIAHLADRYPGEVSLGEQQRAALARAVVVGPRLLVADEPVSHQNRAFADVMMWLLVDLAASGTACLLATHDEAAVERAHRVLELHDGRIHGARCPIA